MCDVVSPGWAHQVEEALLCQEQSPLLDPTLGVIRLADFGREINPVVLWLFAGARRTGKGFLDTLELVQHELFSFGEDDV